MSTKLMCPDCGSKHCVMQSQNSVHGRFLHCMKCDARFLQDGSKVEDTLTLNGMHMRIKALEAMVEQLYYAPGAPGCLATGDDFDRLKGS